MKETTIISAFPCSGKSHACRELSSDFTMIDSDSSEFSWIKNPDGTNSNVRNPEFPANYMDHIQDNIGKVDFIFVSSHKNVRMAMHLCHIPYVLVMPNDRMKCEIIGRMYLRGDSDKAIRFIADNYDSFIHDIYKFEKVARLSSNGYLSRGLLKALADPFSHYW